MEYTKIRLDFKYGPKNRFYRVVLIKGNPDLFKLSIMFGTVLGATFEHCFLITYNNRKTQYVMAPFMENPLPGYNYIRKFHLSDLPDNFVFEYDTGDGWDFTCKKYRKSIEYKSNKDIILLEGAGQGIWEDNICSLYALFEGDIDSDFDGEDAERGIYKPWNFPVDKYSDFDQPLILEDENELLNEECESNLDEVLKNEKEYIKQSGLSLDNNGQFYNSRLKNAILNVVDEQIKTLPYVKDVYERLKSKKGEEKAKEAIASVLVVYIYDMEKKQLNFDDSEYKKRLEVL